MPFHNSNALQFWVQSAAMRKFEVICNAMFDQDNSVYDTAGMLKLDVLGKKMQM